jgi:hypothetical protein
MKDEGSTLKGWPAVSAFLMLVVANALTALALALPTSWLVNRVFAASAIHAIFASNQLGYWRCVGVFAICFAAKGRIKWMVKS